MLLLGALFLGWGKSSLNVLSKQLANAIAERQAALFFSFNLSLIDMEWLLNISICTLDNNSNEFHVNEKQQKKR